MKYPNYLSSLTLKNHIENYKLDLQHQGLFNMSNIKEKYVDNNNLKSEPVKKNKKKKKKRVKIEEEYNKPAENIENK